MINLLLLRCCRAAKLLMPVTFWTLWGLCGPFPDVRADGHLETDFALPAGAIRLFNGHDASGWVARGGGPVPWRVENNYLEVVPGSGDIVTRQAFGDCWLHAEFWIPLMADQAGQARGNSGIFLQGRYEVQILDSFDNETYPTGACAALYGTIAPRSNVSKPPGQWQTYDITFHCPRVDGKGRVIEQGHISVFHNEVLVIADGRFDQPTGSARGQKPVALAPIRLQDHGAAVRFRNLWLVPLSKRLPGSLDPSGRKQVLRTPGRTGPIER